MRGVNRSQEAGAAGLGVPAPLHTDLLDAAADRLGNCGHGVQYNLAAFIAQGKCCSAQEQGTRAAAAWPPQRSTTPSPP